MATGLALEWATEFAPVAPSRWKILPGLGLSKLVAPTPLPPPGDVRLLKGMGVEMFIGTASGCLPRYRSTMRLTGVERPLPGDPVVTSRLSSTFGVPDGGEKRFIKDQLGSNSKLVCTLGQKLLHPQVSSSQTSDLLH